jgi:hypothetical protein
MGNRTFSGRSKIAIARSGNGVNKKDYFLTIILTFAFSMVGPVSEAQAQANLPTGRASVAELARLPDDIDWQEIARSRYHRPATPAADRPARPGLFAPNR